MLLNSVRLESFKRFEKLEREFGPGINVVKGPLNEIGKSTFLDGLVVALFENPRSTKKELERYTAWGSDRRCKTVIEFEAEGKKYLLEKDFDAKTIRLTRADTGRGWDTPNEVAEKLRKLLGTDSSTLFLSTSCIRQNEVTDISSGRKEIGESLEGIVTGGTGEIVASRVVEKLARNISGLTKGLERPTKSPGPIARLTREISDLQQALAQIEGEVTGVERQKVKLVEVSSELEGVKVKLGEAEALLQKNKRRQQIEETIDKLGKEYEKIDALICDIELLKKQIQDAELGLRAIEGFGDVQKVLEVKNQLPELEASRKSIGDDLPERRHELETAGEYFKRNRLLAALASKTGLIVGVVVSVAGFLGMLFNTASLAVGIIGLVFLIGTMWGRSSLAQHKTQIFDLQSRIGRMEKALTEIEEQERGILSQVNCGSVEEFRQKEERHGELTGRKDAIQNQLLGKLDSQTLEQVDKQRREIARMLAEEREKLTDDLRSTILSPEEYVKLEKKAEDLGSRKGELQRIKMECEVGIEKARFDVEDQTQREEMLDGLMNTLNRERRRLKVYELARDFVSKARAETLLSTTDLLQAETQKNLEVFTRGKYSKVRIGEGSMDFWIYSDEKGDWVSPEELSGGVIDEFYLACRLALVRLIYGETRPPLVLDDPFVNFDEPRVMQTLEFLSELSKEYQIIIFTLRDTYDGMADKVIELT
ncbi:MAG: AAA family ATPase, partial [Chloroflexota bacterium]|nr:AAA family ATPase [Chloroflexota bacterium]